MLLGMVQWEKHLLIKYFIALTLCLYWLFQRKLHLQLESAVYSFKIPCFNMKS